ncbi:MAG: ChaN family lipoprotein [Thermodesulfovibrionales bacterium]|nr:ChaN family lipoprotein [Thermodesulfovibrionales bacterium]
MLNKSSIRLLIIIILLFAPVIAGARQSLPEYNLNVSLDIPASKITATAKIDIHSKNTAVHIGNLRILDVTFNKRSVPFEVQKGVLKISGFDKGSVEIKYEGIFNESPNVISEKGISLTGFWYPQAEGLFKYRLMAALPEGYEAVSEAEEIVKSSKNGISQFAFEFNHPVDGISLIATKRYQITKDSFNNIEIFAYFFPEDTRAAKLYLEYAKRYLAMYEKLFGKYPYKRFSIVENFLPTGLSMPTYTLLGQDVVNLPFIVETSLGHEILHQWFGNLVYIDYEKGNWAEGLTTYLSDHLYVEQKGKGWEYRKQILIDYMNYVNKENEFPVKDFSGRVDFSTRAIGYGKTAMIFHMLKNMMGADIFYGALRDIVNEKRFQRASWDDLKKSFERHYKKDLSVFFTQWIDEKGLPEINLRDVSMKRNGSRFELNFTIFQKSKVYVMDVPVIFYGQDGIRKKDFFRIDKEKNTFRVFLDNEPEKIVIDEDYDMFRMLNSEEIPPVIAGVIGEERPLIVLPASNKEAYTGIVNALKEKGGIEKEVKGIKEADIKNSALVILGNDNPLINRLYGNVVLDKAGFNIVAKKNPWNINKTIGIISVSSKAEADAAFKKIFHYGKYSELSFNNGRNAGKNIKESQRGISMTSFKPAVAIAVSAVKTLPDVIDAVSGKKIVYIGEQHDQSSHHNTQLEIIKGLYKKNKRIAIGMEMFQRPFQKTLDDYIEGRIEEREFLKKSEYFKRWGFDYNLYKPILDFARTEKIPVVALNIRREIINKVSTGGIDSLSDEEKKEIPPDMDFSDEEYKEKLKKVFGMHRNSKDRNFDYFYQSQIVWDETMAMSIDEFFKKNSDFQKNGQIVVVAGGGHIEYSSGIPKRTFRKNGYPFATILMDRDIETGIADYIVFPATMEGIIAPKLMAALSDKDGIIKIENLPEDSISKKAGLEEGDIITNLDGVPVSSVDDIRIHLFYKKAGDLLKVKIIRKMFIFGNKEMEFDVQLKDKI